MGILDNYPELQYQLKEEDQQTGSLLELKS